jgi:hypothetical protein
MNQNDLTTILWLQARLLVVFAQHGVEVSRIHPLDLSL